MPFTDRQIAALKPKTVRYEKKEPGRTGLCIRVSPDGTKSWSFLYRIKGKQRRMTFGVYPTMNLSKAHKALADAKDKARTGIDPGAEIAEERKVERRKEEETVEITVAEFIKRHVRKKTDKKPEGLRSAAEVERIFKVCILPDWRTRAFTGINRTDVVRLLDDIEENRGAVMADRVLTILSKLFTWYAIRHHDYISPIIPGMARTSPSDRARQRFLDDDEIRFLWPIWQEAGPFGAMLQIALLTGQRRAKTAGMRWEDIDFETGLWTIPTEKGEKTNPGSLILPAMALDIIGARPVLKGNPYVFCSQGTAHIAGYSERKRVLDATIAEAGGSLDRWTIHDLRRTAKSLMARTGIRPDISERVLGHVIGGVEGTYDRYDYGPEKADALVKLAALLERIINPPSDNVIAITG